MSVLNHLYGLRRAVGLMALLTGLAGNSHAQAPDPLSSWNDGGAKATHRCFIVLSGGIEFMRPWTERVYGIPPEQVVGSSGGLKYELCDWQAGTREAAHLGAPQRQGRQAGGHTAAHRAPPIGAFGNSDGNFEMQAWTTSAPGARLGLIVHHDDGVREFAYDRKLHVGQLDRGLNEAGARGWTVVSMKDDWKTIFAPAR